MNKIGRQNVDCGIEVKMKRKGQFKIQQMAFMLVGLMIFFILVGLFWIILQRQSLYDEAIMLREREAIQIAQFMADSSEFNCQGNPGYCINTDKIMALDNVTSYDGYWPVDYVRLAQMHPADEEIRCTRANYPDCTVYDVYENEDVTSTSSMSSYVALCRYERVEGYATQICELGKIIIGYDMARMGN